MAIFNSEEQAQILHAISLAENKTSGEIRVALERRSKTDAMDRAAYFFRKLGMHRTSQRNGVLIYLAVDDHVFAIIGDEGIDRRVGKAFWEETKSLMSSRFREGALVAGIVDGILHAGVQLQKYFPLGEDDINELPDELVFGDQ